MNKLQQIETLAAVLSALNMQRNGINKQIREVQSQLGKLLGAPLPSVAYSAHYANYEKRTMGKHETALRAKLGKGVRFSPNMIAELQLVGDREAQCERFAMLINSKQVKRKVNGWRKTETYKQVNK